MEKILVSIILLISIVLYGFTSELSAQERVFSNEQWVEDIDYLDNKIKSEHPEPFRHVSKEEWDESISNFKDELKKLSDKDIVFRFQEILASLQDDNTSMSIVSALSSYDKNVEDQDDILFYPIHFKWLKDELVVYKVIKEKEDLLGAKLVAINGINIDDILEKLYTIVGNDNTESAKLDSTIYLSNYDALEYLDIVSTQNTKFTLLTEENEEVTVDFVAKPNEEVNLVNLSSKNKEIPIAYEKMQDDNSFSTPVYLPNSKIKINICE